MLTNSNSFNLTKKSIFRLLTILNKVLEDKET